MKKLKRIFISLGLVAAVVDYTNPWINTTGSTSASSYASATFYGAPYSWSNTTYDAE